MRPWLRVPAETGNLGKVKTELILQPVDGIARAAGKDTDEIITGKVAGLL